MTACMNLGNLISVLQYRIITPKSQNVLTRNQFALFCIQLKGKTLNFHQIVGFFFGNFINFFVYHIVPRGHTCVTLCVRTSIFIFTFFPSFLFVSIATINHQHFFIFFFYSRLCIMLYASPHFRYLLPF